jgi:hypothetical protein
MRQNSICYSEISDLNNLFEVISVKKVKKLLIHKKVAKKVMHRVVVKAPANVPVKTALPVVIPLKVVTPVPVPVKVATPVVKRLLYVEVTPDKYFVLCDGRKIKSGKELADTLQLISDDMFKYHVTDAKNDFANWINDVFGEPDVAKKIRTIRNRLEMSVELYRHMFDKLDKLTRK